MSQRDLERLENWLGCALPSMHRSVLDSHGGKFVGDRVCFYSAAELVERNETYQTKVYCPAYYTIGDDSGGVAVMLSKTNTSCPVYLVDHGSMDPDDFILASSSLAHWIASGCPLPDGQ